MTEPTRIADYERGYRDALSEAVRLVTCAPVIVHGERRAGGAGVPRVLDRAINPDGDPDYVRNTYALRDAVLYWLRVAGDNLGDGGVGQAARLGDGAES